MTKYEKFHWFMLGLCAWPVAGLLVLGTLAADMDTTPKPSTTINPYITNVPPGPNAVLAAGKIDPEPNSWAMAPIRVDADGYVICSEQKPK